MELNNIRIQSKKDTTENWESINPVLLDGETGIEETTDGNFKIKIGDGEKTWSLLPYIKSDTIEDLSKYITKSGAEMDENASIKFGTQLVLQKGYIDLTDEQETTPVTIQNGIKVGNTSQGYCNLQGDGLTCGDNHFGSNTARVVNTPTVATDIANKQYVDNAVASASGGGSAMNIYNIQLLNSSWATGAVNNESVNGMYTQEITTKTFESNDKVDILIPPSLYNSIPCGIYAVNISGRVYAATEFPPDVDIDVQILVSKINVN